MKRTILCNECHAQFGSGHRECPDCGGVDLSWIRRYDGSEDHEDRPQEGHKKRALNEYDDR